MSVFPTEHSVFVTSRMEIDRMSPCVEAASLLRSIAEPRPVGDTVKSAINRAARRVSAFLQEPMRPGRAEDIWRGEARIIRAEEIDAIRRAADARDQRETTNEFALLKARLDRLEARFLQGEEQDRAVADEVRVAARADRCPVVGGRR
ncbi:hypothetical protein LB518_22925 [Mesorhizobium sp. BR1-1-16]|uniref:hypothetical protein n=1 Tax=Mesorhizobium sp. BR1-1-16 TaxID=2876653 RepID=UPI001CCEBEE1|nr:hypothetical protein [Mesorhizobium sp. BR1-1-16]MBZ9939169.1 hypothetical protein [Mesorhizobium sp. BR1-1-16]